MRAFLSLMGFDRSSPFAIMPLLTISHANQRACQSDKFGIGCSAYWDALVGNVTVANDNIWISIWKTQCKLAG